MSRASAAIAPPAPPTDPTADLPTLRGYDAVVGYCDELGIDLTANFIKVSYQAGELPGFVIAHSVRFARADVVTWLRGHRRS